MKQLLRMQHLALRNSLTREEVEKKSRKIADSFLQLPLLKEAKTIMLYVGVKNEVQTKGLIEKLLQQGKRVIVPVTEFKKRELLLSEIKGWPDLEQKGTGLIEPKRDKIRPVEAKGLGLIVVPGVVFDREGYRIGTGFGFYDKLLRKISRRISLVGFCFEENLVERLTAESHDVKMNIVVTDREIIRIG